VRAWALGSPSRIIIEETQLGARKVREVVAACNRAVKTPRQRVQHRRDATATTRIIGAKGEFGQRRMMSVKEVNAHLRGRREFSKTSYWATVRDVRALGLQRHVVRTSRSAGHRAGSLGRGAGKLRELLKYVLAEQG
jgi:hypothetical protein